MEIISTQEEFGKAGSRQLIKLKCQQCGKVFEKRKHHVQAQGARATKRKQATGCYCSHKCSMLHRSAGKYHEVACAQCGKKIIRSVLRPTNNKSDRRFCNHFCSVIYNNLHKTFCPRSKLELYLEKQLTQKYPNLEIHYNRKDAILSELDIYIPSLKLGIELNGPLHYEPIHGQNTLTKIQNNDARKFQACLERGIELMIVDSSKLTYTKERTMRPFWEMVWPIIDTKLKTQSLQPSQLLPPTVQK